MEIVKANTSDQEDSIKYLLTFQGKEVGYGYLFDRAINPIEIYITKEYQSNGCGKFLFQYLAEVMKKQGDTGMIFELTKDQIRFQNIIMQAGAVQVGAYKDKIKYILKLK